MAFNLMLENGDRLLLENGNGIFLESYIPPNNNLTVDVDVAAPQVTCVLRVNTPKFFEWDLVMASPVVVTLGSLVSSDPAKFIGAIEVVVDDAVVNFAGGIDVSTPRHLKPIRHYVWVHGLDGEQVNVLD